MTLPCPRCGLVREINDHQLPESCIRALKGRVRALEIALTSAVAGFEDHPGISDLDDEQPMHARALLGQVRRWRALCKS